MLPAGHADLRRGNLGRGVLSLEHRHLRRRDVLPHRRSGLHRQQREPDLLPGRPVYERRLLPQQSGLHEQRGRAILLQCEQHLYRNLMLPRRSDLHGCIRYAVLLPERPAVHAVPERPSACVLCPGSRSVYERKRTVGLLQLRPGLQLQWSRRRLLRAVQGLRGHERATGLLWDGGRLLHTKRHPCVLQRAAEYLHRERQRGVLLICTVPARTQRRPGVLCKSGAGLL